MMTPEEIAFAVWMGVPRLGSPTLRNMQPDNEALLVAIAAAIRDAYERAATLAETIGDAEHEQSTDPQEDMSDRTGEKIAAAIRALKGEG